MSSDSQYPVHLRPEVDAYEGLKVEPRGVGAIASFLQSRPSSDIALVGALLTNAYLGGKLIEAGYPGGGIAAVAISTLMCLLLRRQERRERVTVTQARTLQPGAQPKG